MLQRAVAVFDRKAGHFEVVFDLVDVLVLADVWIDVSMARSMLVIQ